MTVQQQREISTRFRRFVDRYAGKQTPTGFKAGIHTIAINKALRAQINQYIDNGTLMAVTSEPMYPVLVQLYKTSAKIWAHQSHIQTRQAAGSRKSRVLAYSADDDLVEEPLQHKGRQPMGFSERIVELMRQYYGIDLLNVAEGLTETTKRTIEAVLSEAAQLGWSFNEIVKRLQAPELTAARARLIARTETVSAANGAAVINAKETAAKTGLKLNKIWIAATDSRTRPDHAEINQHVVGIDDYFIVGGFPMSAPGDRRHGAPADQLCNCRCCVAFIPVN